MENSYFMNAYNKRMKQRLILVGVITIILMGSFVFGIIKFYNNKNNPVIISTDDDYQKALSRGSFVQVNANKVYNLGLKITEKRIKYGVKIGKETKSNIIAVKIDKKILPITVSTDEYNQLINDQGESFTFKGKLTKIDSDDLPNFAQALIRGGIPSNEVDNIAYTNYLQLSAPYEDSLIYFFICGILIIVLLIVFMPVVYRNEKALRSLNNYTNGNIDIVCNTIDKEINKDFVYRNGSMIITENYVVVDSYQIVFALPLNEVVWVYKKVKNQKLNKVAKIIKSEYLIFVFSDKSTFKVNVKNADNTIEYIRQNYKTIIIGYSKELNRLCKKNTRAFMNKWREQKNNFMDKI